MRFLLALIFLAGASACADYLQFSPYATDSSQTELTQKALTRIRETSNASFFPFSFTVLADTHAAYTDTRDAVRSARPLRESAAFAVVAGDITDHGLLQEYERSHELLAGLGTPYVTVIGNHDALSNGKRIYRRMYGRFNYTFQYNNVQFILLNNVRVQFGDGVPDLDWLEAQLVDAATYQHVIVVAHISISNEVFSSQQRQRFRALMAEHNVSLVIHGHAHNRSLTRLARLDGGDTQYLINGSVDKRVYSLVQVSADAVEVQARKF